MKAWFATLLLLTAPALAGGDNHFPQPVRVGDLIGQKLIGPAEAQPLLGTIEAVEHPTGGALAMRVRTRSLLPWGGRSVLVPVDAIAFLGPQLALTGLTEAQLDALPAAAAAAALPPDEIVRVDLIKPFH